MADNIANLLPPSSIRLSVEPVQVDLESADGSLLFSALQSAFPQSTGIYFRPKGAECRVMLKFDGRRFLAPNGGWSSGVDYFVELNAGRHNTFPFGSYEHASKQFERSVNLVQRMMNGGSGGTMLTAGGGPKKSFGTLANLPPNDRREEADLLDEPIGLPSPQQQQQRMALAEEQIGHAAAEQREENKKAELTPERRRSSGQMSAGNCSLTNSGRTLKNVERDFADLAHICAGKDAIIDGQRRELDEVRQQLEKLQKAEAEWAETEAEWRAKWEAAERELAMMRELGRDQEGLHGQIVQMQGQMQEEMAKWERTRAELELESRRWQREAVEWKDKSELGTWTISELNDQLKKAQRERADLQRKTAILEEQVNGEAIEFNRRFQEREKVQLELLTDNTRLYQLKEQLETQCRELREQLARIETEFEHKMDTFRAHYEAKENSLGENLAMADSKIAQMEKQIKELMAEKENAEKQIQKLRNHTEIGHSDPLFAYSQG